MRRQAYGNLPGRRVLPLGWYSFSAPLRIKGWVGPRGRSNTKNDHGTISVRTGYDVEWLGWCDNVTTRRDLQRNVIDTNTCERERRRLEGDKDGLTQCWGTTCVRMSWDWLMTDAGVHSWRSNDTDVSPTVADTHDETQPLHVAASALQLLKSLTLSPSRQLFKCIPTVMLLSSSRDPLFRR